MKTVIYGLGQHWNRISRKCVLPMGEIVAYVDNNPSKVGNVGGKSVITHEELKQYDFELIIITSPMYYEEIVERIKKDFGDVAIKFIDDWVSEYGYNYTSDYERKQKEELEGVKELLVLNGPIRTMDLADAKLLADRIEALKYIKKGGIAAEIGVAFGDFSKKILKTLEPQKFYAIDMFSMVTKGFWNNMMFVESGLSHYEWYAKEFKKEIEEGLCELKKGLSWECLEEFPDDYLDYAYVDAAHDYESVKRDIAVLKRKVKAGGIIQFNDYVRFDINAAICYGVVPAVNGFVHETGSKILFYCLNRDGFDDIVIRLNK